MIQRIQSVYLIIAFFISIVLIFLPYAELYSDGFSLSFSTLGIDRIGLEMNENYDNAIILTALHGLLIALPLIALFLFKHRKSQMRIVRVGLWICLATLGFMAISVLNEYGMNELSYRFKIGLIIPLIYGVLLMLAYRNIKKDDELIKSVDRIR